MNQTEAQELLKKYNAGTATDEERAIIENWYANSSYPAAAPEEKNIIAAKDEIWAAMNIQPRRTIRLWPRIAQQLLSYYSSLLVLIFILSLTFHKRCLLSSRIYYRDITKQH
jgi:hypothetical protein